MQIVPRAGGALLVEQPAPTTVYDLGNARVYAQCDAQGRITRASLPEGTPLHTMRAVRYAVLDEHVVTGVATADAVAHSLADQFKGTDSEGSGKQVKRLWTTAATQPIDFESAWALGRTWELSGQCAGLSVTLTTFLDDASPAIFQRVQITNNGAETRILTLDVVVTLQFERYVASGTGPGGRVHTRVNTEARFDATLRPWLVVMDKVETVLCYALPIAPGQSQEFCLLSGAGDDATFDRMLHGWRESYTAAEAYNNRLVSYATVDDPLLQSLIVAGLNAGLAAYKKLDSGVSGFLAGVSYAYPPRVYFRDSYWTAQAALIVQPAMVRENLLWLASGIAPNGACPSGVWNPGLFTQAELDTPGVLSWIPDHYDSPSFFVMLLHDYVVASGDYALLDEPVHGTTMLQHAIACMDYLIGCDQDGDGLFEKPHAANDWADNVLRDGLVTYDLALFYRGLVCLVWLARQRGDPALVERYQAYAQQVQQGINAKLWDEALGYYRNYQNQRFAETNLSIDALLTLLYGIADERQSARCVEAARRYLQTRNNPDQSYGDWGVMCCYPFYRDSSALFSISAEQYHYHNGADWPYWDGVYGLILLQRDDPDWRYVLARWWEIALEQGLLTPFEYAAPPYPHGGLLQGWSAMPAVALLYKKHVTWLQVEAEPTR